MANPLRRVYPDAMMEHLGHAAAEAETEAEAEAFIGALVPLAAGLVRSAAPHVARATPHLVRGLSKVARTLRRNPTTRPLVRALPTIASRTTRSLARRLPMAVRSRPAGRSGPWPGRPRPCCPTRGRATRSSDTPGHWTAGITAPPEPASGGRGFPAGSATGVRALAPRPTTHGFPAPDRRGPPVVRWARVRYGRRTATVARSGTGPRPGTGRRVRYGVPAPAGRQPGGRGGGRCCSGLSATAVPGGTFHRLGSGAGLAWQPSAAGRLPY